MTKFTQRLIERSPSHFEMVLDFAEGSKPPLDPPVWTIWREELDDSILGFIPFFLDYMDERPAAEQFHESFSHGGGWLPIRGFERKGVGIQFPGDPELSPLASTSLRHEDIFFYNHGWVMILNTQDNSYEVARLA